MYSREEHNFVFQLTKNLKYSNNSWVIVFVSFCLLNEVKSCSVSLSEKNMFYPKQFYQKDRAFFSKVTFKPKDLNCLFV